MQSVTAQDLDGIKAMIDETMKPYSVASLGVILTSVVADETDGMVTTVASSDTRGTGVSPHAVEAAITLPTGLALPNTSVILAEVVVLVPVDARDDDRRLGALSAQAYQRPRLTLQVLKN